MILPQKLFLTKGKGYHKDKLLSFEMALRSAGIEKQNLVLVSSIFPPGCKILPKKEGLKLLKPGEITFCVMSKIQTQNPGELISSALAISLPENKKSYGYIYECSFSKKSKKETENYAKKLAEELLKLKGILPERTLSVSESCRAKKGNVWTTIICAAVFIE